MSAHGVLDYASRAAQLSGFPARILYNAKMTMVHALRDMYSSISDVAGCLFRK